MPRTGAKSGYGSKVYFETSPGTFVEVGEISGDISGLGKQPEYADATHMASPGGVEEKVPTGITTLPNITFEANFVTPGDASQRALLAAVEAKSLNNYRITLGPSPTERVEGAAYIAYEHSLAMRSPMKLNFTLTRSGPWSLAAHP